MEQFGSGRSLLVLHIAGLHKYTRDILVLALFGADLKYLVRVSRATVTFLSPATNGKANCFGSYLRVLVAPAE